MLFINKPRYSQVNLVTDGVRSGILVARGLKVVMDTKCEEFQECLHPGETRGEMVTMDTTESQLTEPTVKSKIVIPPKTEWLMTQARALSPRGGA